jgi:arylformamidase
VTDWESHSVPADIIKGCLCCSGGYDLEPVKLSARNDYMHLSDEAVRLYSPNHHLSQLGCPLSLAVGELESDEFVRQSVDFAAAAGLPLHKAANMDHFEISMTLGREGGLLAGLALEQIFGVSRGED